MYEVIKQFLPAFDEYPVENFHSVLRTSTNEKDTAEQIHVKAKEIDACKKEMQKFQSSFLPHKRFNFSRKRIDNLKTKAAKFVSPSLRPSICNLVEHATSPDNLSREEVSQNGSYQICLAISWLPTECPRLDFRQWNSHLTQIGKCLVDTSDTSE